MQDNRKEPDGSCILPGWADGTEQSPPPHTRARRAGRRSRLSAPGRCNRAAIEHLAGLPAANLAPLASLAGSAAALDVARALLIRLGHEIEDLDLVVGPRRYRDLVRVRHALIWYFRERLGVTYPVIARTFQRDASSVQYAVRAFRRAIEDGAPWAVRNLTALTTPTAKEQA